MSAKAAVSLLSSPMRNARVSLGAAVILASAGCSTAEQTSPVGADVVIRQSIDASRGLSLEEVWRVGHPDDPNQLELFRVWGATLLDGVTYVLEWGNHRVVMLDEEGRYLGQFGSEGDGPGEFRQATQFAAVRDTILVRDGANRVHFFRANGELLSTHRLSFPDPEVNRLGMVGSTPSGWLVTASGYFRGEGSTELPPLLRSHFFSIDPTTGSTEPHELEQSLESIGQFSGAFWVQPVATHSPSGALDGLGRYLTADTASYRIDVYDLSGERLFRIENDVRRHPIDDEFVALWEDARACGEGSPECSASRNDLAKSMTTTEHRPVVSRLRAFPSGHFSVRRVDLDPNPFDRESLFAYDFFDPEGGFLGHSVGSIPLWFDGNSLVAMERDPLGVESIAMYRVR